jgi:hypothetical protein
MSQQKSQKKLNNNLIVNNDGRLSESQWVELYKTSTTDFFKNIYSEKLLDLGYSKEKLKQL